MSDLICPTCGKESDVVWKCSHCGKPFDGDESSGSQQLRPDGGEIIQSTHSIVIDALEELGDHDGPDGIARSDVIDHVAEQTEVSRAEIQESIEFQHNEGEVYDPAGTNGERLKRTCPDGTGWSP